jgi:AmiR/NasT family two-component response regulator
MRKLVPDVVDLVVINERIWPEGPCLQEILALGLGVVMVTSAERLERFRLLGHTSPIVFAAPGADSEHLWLALVTALSNLRREAEWKVQVARLQQRLSDRIVIERAKGILVQRLKISEEDAYKRLRMLSRRQRRQIREIAQSLLDTQFLLAPGMNGFGDLGALEGEEGSVPPPAARKEE